MGLGESPHSSFLMKASCETPYGLGRKPAQLVFDEGFMRYAISRPTVLPQETTSRAQFQAKIPGLGLGPRPRQLQAIQIKQHIWGPILRFSASFRPKTYSALTQVRPQLADFKICFLGRRCFLFEKKVLDMGVYGVFAISAPNPGLGAVLD